MEHTDDFKEAFRRSAEQIHNENRDIHAEDLLKKLEVTDITWHRDVSSIKPTDVVWVSVHQQNDNKDYAIAGSRYLKNLSDVIAERRERTIEENLGI